MRPLLARPLAAAASALALLVSARAHAEPPAFAEPPPAAGSPARSDEPRLATVRHAEREPVIVGDDEPMAEVHLRVPTSARDVTASTHHVSARAFAAAPRLRAEDALRLVPGLTLVQHGSEGKGHQFLLRGFDAAHGADFEVSVDGVVVNEWSNVHGQGYVDLGFVIPEAVSAVTVTKGPFALEQGPFALAGSARYELGVAEEDRGVRIGYTLGTSGRQRLVASYSPEGGDGRELVAVEGLEDDGFGQNRGSERAGALARVRLVDAESHELWLAGAASHAEFELPGAVRDDDVAARRIGFYDSYDTAARGRSQRALLWLRYVARTELGELELVAHGGYRELDLLENYTGFALDAERGDRRQQTEQRGEYGATLRYDARLVDELELVLGAGVSGDRLEQRQHRAGDDARPFLTERALFADQVLAHGLLGASLRLLDTWQLRAGARLDAVYVDAEDRLPPPPDVTRADGEDLLLVVAPRLALEWRATPGLALFAAYGHGARPPEARAFSAFAPAQVGIGEERAPAGAPRVTVARSVELGARVASGPRFEASAAAFSTFVARESVLDHVSGLNLELNATRRSGVELSLSASPSAWLELNASTTWVHARFVESGNEVPFAPWLAGSAHAIVDHPSGVRAGLLARAAAPRALPHGARGATFFTLDATLGYHLGALELELELENLLGRRLREGEYHYASHWQRDAPASALPVLHTVAGPPRSARLTVAIVF